MSEKEVEIRIKCRDSVRHYGKVTVNEESLVKNTPLFKSVTKIAESCIHGKSSNKCEVITSNVDDENHFNDITTPCGSTIATKEQKQRDQLLANITFGFIFCFTVLFIGVIIGMISEEMEDWFTLAIVLVAYLSFSLSLIGDTQGKAGKRLKTIVGLSALILTLSKLGLFQLLFGN
jgi:hypothetical protein